jgi:prepilin-type N-terminal cleavage/methylation domain-containing protein
LWASEVSSKHKHLKVTQRGHLLMLHKLKNRKSEGFTIIEVLIVLAIAGLILLIVFLAVPALQRNSRNTSRREDVSHLAGLVDEYAANHGGVLPTGAQLVSVTTNEKWAIITTPVAADVLTSGTFGTTSTAKINEGYTCDTTTNTLTAGSARAFSISYQVETGGADQNACVTG